MVTWESGVPERLVSWSGSAENIKQLSFLYGKLTIAATLIRCGLLKPSQQCSKLSFNPDRPGSLERCQSFFLAESRLRPVLLLGSLAKHTSICSCNMFSGLSLRWQTFRCCGLRAQTQQRTKAALCLEHRKTWKCFPLTRSYDTNSWLAN